MMATSLKYLILCLLLSCLVSCAAHQPVTTQPSTAPSESKRVVLWRESKLGPIPVVSWDGEPAFSRADMDKIVAFANTKAPGKQVWYIDVHLYGKYKGVSVWNTTLYFVPDVTRPRIQRGKCLYIRSEWIHPEDKLPGYPATLDVSHAEASDYVLVPAPGAVLARDLPTGIAAPFGASETFSDEEIIEIADFVRSIGPQPPIITKQLPDGSISSSLSPMFGFDPKQPILSITRRDDGKIEVETGNVWELLAGSGNVLTLEKADGRWKVISCGQWVA
jgi:hypothetical protein